MKQILVKWLLMCNFDKRMKFLLCTLLFAFIFLFFYILLFLLISSFPFYFVFFLFFLIFIYLLPPRPIHFSSSLSPHVAYTTMPPLLPVPLHLPMSSLSIVPPPRSLVGKRVTLPLRTRVQPQGELIFSTASPSNCSRECIL